MDLSRLSEALSEALLANDESVLELFAEIDADGSGSVTIE